jgi:hypothetical protein
VVVEEQLTRVVQALTQTEPHKTVALAVVLELTLTHRLKLDLEQLGRVVMVELLL